MTKNLVQNKISALTKMGVVTLNVENLDKMLNFYSKCVGLEILDQSKDSILLGSGKNAILRLNHEKSLSYAKPGSAGLYHTAVLFDNPADLALVLKRMLETVPQLFEGSGDHFVSQAFYFHDPENNGLELYVDRPSDEWIWVNGYVSMGVDYIHPGTFLKENSTGANVAPKAKVGHIHLKVGSIEKAKNFYVRTLGFDVTTELPTALFVSAGGYHHHLGMNVWESQGSAEREDTIGLDSFEILIPDLVEKEKIELKLKDNNIVYEISSNGLVTTDPWGNKIIFSISNPTV